MAMESTKVARALLRRGGLLKVAASPDRTSAHLLRQEGSEAGSRRAAGQDLNPTWGHRPTPCIDRRLLLPCIDRRLLLPLVATSLSCLLCALPLPSLASEEEAKPSPPAAEVRVRIELREGADLEGLGPAPTLVLTAKPSNLRIPYASRKVSAKYLLGRQVVIY